jgi:hypothetical protein
MTLMHGNHNDDTYLPIDDPAAGILRGFDLQEFKMAVTVMTTEDADGDNNVSVYSVHFTIHTHCFRTQGARMPTNMLNHVPQVKTPTLSEDHHNMARLCQWTTLMQTSEQRR